MVFKILEKIVVVDFLWLYDDNIQIFIQDKKNTSSKSSLLSSIKKKIIKNICLFVLRSGSIDIYEFAALWKYIQEWKSCFDR